MKRIFLIAVAVLVCLTVVRELWAAPIYSQTEPSEPVGAFSSQDAGYPYQKVADNFRFDGAGAVTIRSLRFIGGYGLTSPPPITPPLDALPTDAFRIVFLTDSAGAPGAPLAQGDFHVGAAVRRSPTGGPLLNGDETPLEFSVDLGTGITLSAATTYWVSIANDPGPDYGWAWARAEGVLDQQVAATLGNVLTDPWSVSPGGGMFFELSDNNVPEPSSFIMFLLCGCALWRISVNARPRRCCIFRGATQES